MKRILVIDDEPLIRDSLQRALKNYNAEVRTAKNGGEALVEIDACLYDICFLDLWLPDSYGLDLLPRIKEVSPESKVIVMSGAPLNDEAKQIIDRDAHVFIAKPFELVRIRELVGELLEQNHGNGVGHEEEHSNRTSGGAEEWKGIQKERRRSPRRPFAKSLTCSVENSGDQPPVMVELRAEVIDVSPFGISLRTSSPLQPGILIRFPAVNDGIAGTAGIVRNSAVLDSASFRSGIEFI